MLPYKYTITILFLLWMMRVQSQHVTYESDVKPVMQKHCVSCHAKGEAGPMPLTTYEEVADYGEMIAYVTSRKLMPPWYADPAYSHFKNERILSAKEIQTLRDWVANDKKPGALPYGMAISNVAGVTVYPREPDLVLGMNSSFEQPGDYMDRFRVFRIPTHLTEDTWIEAVEFVPGNKKLVRHAAISVVPNNSNSVSSLEPGYSYHNVANGIKTAVDVLWHTWSPGQQIVYLAEGRGKFIPKDSDLLLYIHYGPSEVAMQDSSFIQLHFASERIKQFMTTVPLINLYNLKEDSIYIQANAEKKFHAAYTLPHEIELYSITPQANLFCRKWEMMAIIPGQPDIVPLLKIDDWNLNWRQTFHLTAPLALPAGTVIYAIAQYDNTKNSPGNHDHDPVDIKLDDESRSEAFSVFFEFTVPVRDIWFPALVHTPSMITHDLLPVYILPSQKGPYRFVVMSMDDHHEHYSQTFTLEEIQQHIELKFSSLPFGNYHLAIWNDENQMVSSHAFLKKKYHNYVDLGR